MQAMLSMMASVAGFLTPGLVASYCLRKPEFIDLSEDHREMSKWTLVAPCLSLLTFMGVVIIQISPLQNVQKLSDEEDSSINDISAKETELVNESTPLVETKS